MEPSIPDWLIAVICILVFAEGIIFGMALARRWFNIRKFSTLRYFKDGYAQGVELMLSMEALDSIAQCPTCTSPMLPELDTDPKLPLPLVTFRCTNCSTAMPYKHKE
jgi:hypothetical protein